MESLLFNELCGAGRKGDLVGGLAADHAVALLRVLGRFAGLPEQEREDIVQDKILQMAEDCADRSDVRNIGAFLNTSVRNAAKSWFRNNAKFVSPQAGPDDDAPADDFADDPDEVEGNLTIGADPASVVAHGELRGRLRDTFEICLANHRRLTSRPHLLPAIWACMVEDMPQTKAWKLTDSASYEAFRVALYQERPLLKKCFEPCRELLKGILE